MVNHLKYTTFNTLRRQSKYTHDNKTQMGYRGIGDELFRIRLYSCIFLSACRMSISILSMRL